jgi:Predicted membrane protein (DUF2142)
MPDDPAPRHMFGPARAAMSRIRERLRGEPLGLTAWLLVAIAVAGMLASSPPSAGPDEPVHEATAWYVTEHLLPPNSPVAFSVPASLVVEPCFAAKPEVTAACEPARSTTTGMVTTSLIVNYPPPYYWAVGAGERVAAVFGLQYADLGGRAASAILNLGALLLLSLYMLRRNRWWGSLLLVVSTPMAVFLGAVVNPSGWEITCGLAMAAGLSETIRGGSPEARGGLRSAVALLLLACLGLCLARPLGFVWAGGLTLSAVALARSWNPRVLLTLACAVAPGVAVGMLWYVTHQAGTPAFSAATSPSALAYGSTPFAASLVYFPLRLFQMFGDLGWLDTPMPSILLFGSLIAWGVLLRQMPSIGRLAMLCGIAGIVIVPSVIESMLSGGWAFWWQGRYTMPFALGFVLLLLLRSGQLAPRTISAASALALLSLGAMVWVNAARYAFGLTASDLPLSLGASALSPLRLAISGLSGGLLVVAGVYLAVRMWRPGRSLVSGSEPDPAPTALVPVPPDNLAG